MGIFRNNPMLQIEELSAPDDNANKLYVGHMKIDCPAGFSTCILAEALEQMTAHLESELVEKLKVVETPCRLVKIRDRRKMANIKHSYHTEEAIDTSSL